MKYLANHQLIELHGCNEKLSNNSKVANILVEAARLGRATIVQKYFHEFSPHGLTGVLVIAESHISIHTWPELGYCAVDVFSCGNKVLHDVIHGFLKAQLGATHTSSISINRGQQND